MGQVSENGFQKTEGHNKEWSNSRKPRQCQTFLSEVVETVDMNDIPGELGPNLVLGALWTMDKRGKKCIDMLVSVSITDSQWNLLFLHV